MSHKVEMLEAPHENVPGWLATVGGWSWRFVASVAAIGLLIFGLAQVKLAFIAVFIALVISAVLRPVTSFLARWMPRALATTIALLGSFAVFGGLLTYVIASVAGQWTNLSDQFTAGIDQILDFLRDGPLPFAVTTEDLSKAVDEAEEWLSSHASEIAGTAFQQAGAVVEGVTTFVLAIFCALFFLTSGDRMWSWFLAQLPARVHGGWSRAGAAGWATFSGYTRGTVIIALTDGLLAGLFLTIIGVPLAAPLGVLVFIGAFIPLIGAPSAMVVAMVVALAADGIVKAAIVGIGIALIGQFEGHILQPLVMGRQVALHPVVVALAVTCGTLVAGILGAVIAVPVTAVVWSVYKVLHGTPDALGASPTPPPGTPPTSTDVSSAPPADDQASATSTKEESES